MAQDGIPRRASLVFPVLLIALGAIFLYANWHPYFDPWPILWTYWPLILIFIGLGTIWDHWRRRQNPDVVVEHHTRTAAEHILEPGLTKQFLRRLEPCSLRMARSIQQPAAHHISR